MPTSTGVAFFPVTTFDGDGEFDERRFRDHVSSTVQRAEFSCVIPLGSVGEFAYLSLKERKRVIEIVIDAVDDDVPVVPGTSAISTRESVDMSVFAERAGASGVLVTPQSYFPPTERNVFNYYRALSKEIDIPIWVYNNPNTTSIDMSTDLMSRLVELDGVEYIKSGTGDMRSFRNLYLRFEDEVPLFAAPPNMFEKLSFGAHGWSGPIATINPKASIRMFDALQNDDVAEAREMFKPWQPLLNYFHEYPYVATMKAILNLQGRDVGPPREPVQPFKQPTRRNLQATMEDLDLV